MKGSIRLAIFRLLPVLFIAAGAIAYVYYVEGPDTYAPRNSVPILLVVLLAALTLYMGGGRWAGQGYRWPLGTLGFAVPAIGLSMYLHYGFATDLDGMFRPVAVSAGSIPLFTPVHDRRGRDRLCHWLDCR